MEHGLFPELPKDLAALTDEELQQQIDQFQNVAAKIGERDADTLGDLTQAEVIDALQAGVEAIEEMKREQDARAEAEATFAAQVAELTARVQNEQTLETGGEAEGDGDDSDGDDSDGDGGEEGDGEEAAAEAETAAAKPATRRPLPAATPRRRPVQTYDDRPHLRASSSVADIVTPGTPLDRDEIGRVLYDVVRTRRVQPGMSLVVASATYPFPDDRILDAKNGVLNMDKIKNVTGHAALTASGGLCAPLTPIYDLPSVESAARPVRDALASFQATRGGVIVGADPVLTDYATAVGHVTAADDALGGTFATKDCMRIECPDFTEVEVDSIYRCIEAGNLTARAYPELMSRIDTLVRANQARAAESFLLDQIVAGSDAVTDVNTTSTAGALWKLVEFVHVAAAGMRSRHRILAGTNLRALFPEWVLDLLVVDSSRNGNDSDRFRTRDQLAGILGRAGINITFYMDSPSSGTSQIFDAQGAGNLDGFPSTTQWGLWPEGSWLHLDSGTLDLGVVRDSTLNSTNDFQIFAEGWENAAFVGVESQWHTATLAPNGTNSAPKDFSTSTNF